MTNKQCMSDKSTCTNFKSESEKGKQRNAADINHHLVLCWTGFHHGNSHHKQDERSKDAASDPVHVLSSQIRVLISMMATFYQVLFWSMWTF